eukprot:gene18874-25432_t
MSPVNMMATEVPLHVLEARYADDSDEDETIAAAEVLPASMDVAAVGSAGKALEAESRAQGTGAQTEGEPVSNGVQEAGDDAEEEEEDDDFTDEDETLAAAEEWADFNEGLQSKGCTGTYFHGGMGARPNAGGGTANRKTIMQPNSNSMQRLDSKFKGGNYRGDHPLEALHGAKVSSSVAANVRVSAKKSDDARIRVVDKADRATVEQAIDPRTRMVLFKMLKNGLYSEINGCISTGKEANVYHARTAEGQDLAVKIYKTSILVFKDRDRYVSGDYRFRSGYCKSNPRKMVKVWAEKENRNLVRLKAAGINAPATLQLRGHVLVMEMIGEDGMAAPRLRDAGLSPAQMRQAYTEMVLIVRQLYRVCHLVHADLSEYNILYHRGELYIIDVSQAVDLDHPKAMDFLKEDCKHVNDYFRKNGVATLSVRELFDFAVDPNIDESNLDDAMERLMEIASSRPLGQNPDEGIEAAIFQQAFIPRTLEEVVHYERDHKAMTTGTGPKEHIFYQGITGMKADLSGARLDPALLVGQKKGGAKLVQEDSSDEEEEGAGDAVPISNSRKGRVTFNSQAKPTGVSRLDDLDEYDDDAGSEDNEDAAPSSTTAPESGVSISAADAASPSASKEAAGEGSSGSGGESEGEDGERRRRRKPKVDKEAVRLARKEHKKAAKETNKERRKTKKPKHEKKKAQSKRKH